MASIKKINYVQLLKKFPTFYGTRRIITAFTSTRQLSVSYMNSNISNSHKIFCPRTLRNKVILYPREAS